MRARRARSATSRAVGLVVVLAVTAASGAAQAQAPTVPAAPSAGHASPAPWGRTVAAPPIAAPTRFLDRGLDPDGQPFPKVATATFQVTYDAGFNANAAAKNAFQSAVDTWSTKVVSSVPIRVNAQFKNLGCPPDDCTLGQASPGEARANFTGAPFPNVNFPLPLANALAGVELNPAIPDINAEFNSNGALAWYFGVDGNPPADKTDFKSVVFHELAHGLGFLGSMTVGVTPPAGQDPDCGTVGHGCHDEIPYIYDRFAQKKAGGTPLLSLPSPSAALGTALKTPGGVLFSGPRTNASGGPAQLYTPAAWAAGSSYSHVDDIYKGTPNAMMTNSQAPGEVTHETGPLMLGMFQDMGWRLNALRPPADFDADRATDVGVFRPSNNTWFLRTGTPQSVPWGGEGDIPVPGDYDGNGTADIAVFRPSNSVWYLRTTAPQSIPWGTDGDIPVPADYDGNGTVDLAVFRPSTGTWYLRTTTPAAIPWGVAGDIPVPGDYDGDGKVDIAVFRPTTNVWYLRTTVPRSITWGAGGDVPVPGDYDGDLAADIAVFRPSSSTWYLRTAAAQAIPWGATGDVPEPGDYDGDGRIDVAVFRPATQVWYIRTATPSSPLWGAAGDIALSLPFAIRRVFF